VDVKKQDVLNEVAGLLESQEEAIRHHPPATAEVYRKGRDAFVSGQHAAAEEPWMRSADLTLEDLTLLRNYMLSSSFISAWYHLHGDKAQRDKAANSCALIVAGLGENPEQVMRRYLHYERLWRRVMKAEGITPSRWRTPSALALVYPVAIALWMSGRVSVVEAIGYGVTQLGYLVAFSTLIFGSFQVLSIGSRWRGLAFGIAFWVLGVVIVNLSSSAV
jgi:hypothetical protein